MADKQGDFYQNLRNQIRSWLESDEGKTNKYAEFLMLTPDLLHLMCKLAIDPDVSVKNKAMLAGAIAYFVSPFDLVPEALTGAVGYVDDIALSAYVLNKLLNDTSSDIVKKHWAGDGDLLQAVQGILAVADQMVGSGLWRKLKGIVNLSSK